MQLHSGHTAPTGNKSWGTPQPAAGQPLTHKEAGVALNWVIGTLPLAIFELATLQGEGEHVLGEGKR